MPFVNSDFYEGGKHVTVCMDLKKLHEGILYKCDPASVTG